MKKMITIIISAFFFQSAPAASSDSIYQVCQNMADKGYHSKASECLEVVNSQYDPYFEDSAVKVCLHMTQRGYHGEAISCVRAINDRNFDQNATRVCQQITSRGYHSTATNCLNAAKDKRYNSAETNICLTSAQRGYNSKAVTCLENSGRPWRDIEQPGRVNRYSLYQIRESLYSLKLKMQRNSYLKRQIVDEVYQINHALENIELPEDRRF